MSINIVEYQPKYRDDMLFCYLLAKDALGIYAPQKYSKPTLKDDLLDIEGNYFVKGDTFFLAVDEDDRVVGMIGTKTVSSDEMWLKRLFVKPNLKGQGIGGRLLESVEIFANGKNITTIYTRFASWYQEAARFYPSKGFSEISNTDEDMRYMVKKIKLA